MQELTLEHAVKNSFTALDCVRYFKPEFTDEQCDFILWEYTCYPFSIEGVIEQLNRKYLHKK
jgi:hypothetical protein